MRLLTLSYMEAATRLLGTHASQKREWKTSYVQFARKLPGLIQVSGLAQAALFVNARGTDPQKQVLKDLGALIRPEEDLTVRLPQMDVLEYQRTVRRAQEGLVVLKRLSASLFDVSEEEANQHDESESA